MAGFVSVGRRAALQGNILHHEYSHGAEALAWWPSSPGSVWAVRGVSGLAPPTAGFDIFDWPRLMLGNGPPVVRARPTLPTSNGRLEVGCAGEERRWICSRSYAANTSSG